MMRYHGMLHLLLGLLLAGCAGAAASSEEEVEEAGAALEATSNRYGVAESARGSGAIDLMNPFFSTAISGNGRQNFTAGTVYLSTVNAVDAYFNVVSTTIAVAVQSSDSNGTPNTVTPIVQPLVNGTTVFAVKFLTAQNSAGTPITQVLTANLAARYHAPLSVAAGATLALWAVAGLAVVGGHGLLSRLPTRPLRLVTGSVLALLSLVGFVAAFR